MSDNSTNFASICLELDNFRGAVDVRAELADLIEIDRTLYHHWVLYVGDGYVVDIVGQNDDDLPDAETAIVRKVLLAHVVADSYARVNNKEVPAKERSLSPFDANQVVQRALSMVGSHVEYNILTRNCEHYLTEWKYGQGWSDQAAVSLSSIRALRSSCTNGHTFLVNTLNEVLNSPGVNLNSSSAHPLVRTTSTFTSVSIQTESTHVN